MWFVVGPSVCEAMPGMPQHVECTPSTTCDNLPPTLYNITIQSQSHSSQTWDEMFSAADCVRMDIHSNSLKKERGEERVSPLVPSHI